MIFQQKINLYNYTLAQIDKILLKQNALLYDKTF